jgi:UDP-N-acetylglucosamine acyltransferase
MQYFMPVTTIGKGCMVFPGAVIGAIPQDLKFVGEKNNC